MLADGGNFMERLGSLDAVFIAVEDTVNHMHIGSVGVFEGPVPSFEAVHALSTAKLQFVPRYRQRVREAPASIGRPLWIDDVDFDLENHLRHTALPTGDRFGLEQLVGRVMSHPLDRRHPLWEMWLIEGLSGDRWALLSKVHHCMVDGIAGTDLLAVVLDAQEQPEPCEHTADTWAPDPEPSPAQLAWHSIAGLAGAPVAGARTLVRAARTPGTAIGAAGDAVRQLGGLTRVAGRLVRSAPASSLTGPIGPHRVWADARVSLDDVKRVRRRHGGTVNDVVLALISAGFRHLLVTRHEPVKDRTLRTLVPVSLRAPDEHGLLDNRVTALFVDLPVGLDDPLDMLHAVRGQMDALKASDEAAGAHALLSATTFLPASAAALAARFVVHQQHTTETVTTNVPGPQVPLYVLGRQMVEAYPYVPVAGKIRVGVAIWSYLGGLHFGVTGDLDGAPDVDVLAKGITNALDQLLTADA
jgi:diacylglycerol O-acyltransferase / wax synthase